MSTAAQKALESEFELDIRVSHVTSTPPVEAEYTNGGECSSFCLLTTITTLTTLLAPTQINC